MQGRSQDINPFSGPFLSDDLPPQKTAAALFEGYFHENFSRSGLVVGPGPTFNFHTEGRNFRLFGLFFL